MTHIVAKADGVLRDSGKLSTVVGWMLNVFRREMEREYAEATVQAPGAKRMAVAVNLPGLFLLRRVRRVDRANCVRDEKFSHACPRTWVATLGQPGTSQI